MKIAFLVGFIALSFAHVFHISKCDVNYSSESETFQQSIHIFIDDLELAIEQNYGHKYLRIGTALEEPIADSLVALYLADNMGIKLDGQVLKSNYLGKEISEDLSAVYCYLESEPATLGNDIEIDIRLLTEVFDDQQNIIRFTVDKEEEGYLLLTRSRPLFSLKL